MIFFLTNAVFITFYPSKKEHWIHGFNNNNKILPSTMVFNFDNKNKCFLSTKAY